MKDNKLFWKTVKPFFSNKGDRGSNIQLVKDNELLQDDQKIADELNTFFKNAVSNLNINENTYIINHNSGNLSDPVDKAIVLFVSINSTQAFYLSKVNWKLRSSFRFNTYQNLTGKKKFKILILRRQLLRTLSRQKY